ncbi:MAG: hypothetical protein UH788_06880 [Treponemataceae bacterium]|nr:hypothetical protein [Treponemataceae bacterium]
MDLTKLLMAKDRGKNKLNIVDIIINQKITKDDLEQLIIILKQEEYLDNDESFVPKNDKSDWTKDYISDLRFRCIQYFSEEYLRHLFDVSSYVKTKAKNKKTLVIGIFVLILLLILGLLFNNNSKNTEAPTIDQTVEQEQVYEQITYTREI